MSVRKIRNAWWVDLRVDYIRYRKKSPENTRAGALAYERRLREKLVRDGSLIKRIAAQSFSEFAMNWLETYAAANNKLSERRMKASILKHHLIPFFGKVPLDRITTEDIERYKARKLGEELAPKTVNNQLTVLGRCLRSAVDWGRIAHMPRVKLMKAHSQNTDFLTQDEMTRLLGAPIVTSVQLMAFTALRSGLRLGELLGLSWSDIDFESNVLTVQHSWVRREMTSPKSHRIRHIPLGGELRALLYAVRRSRGFVFPGVGDKPWSTDGAARELKRLCERTGVRKIGWHVLRHTFASHIAMRGVPMRSLQQLMGHSTILMTERYAHLGMTSLHDAVQVLEPVRENIGHPVGNAKISEGQNRPLEFVIRR